MPCNSPSASLTFGLPHFPPQAFGSVRLAVGYVA